MLRQVSLLLPVRLLHLQPRFLPQCVSKQMLPQGLTPAPHMGESRWSFRVLASTWPALSFWLFGNEPADGKSFLLLSSSAFQPLANMTFSCCQYQWIPFPNSGITNIFKLYKYTSSVFFPNLLSSRHKGKREKGFLQV